MKKITVTLSDKAEKYFNDVMYGLHVSDYRMCTQSEAINEILETNLDFESKEDTNVSGYLEDKYKFYSSQPKP